MSVSLSYRLSQEHNAQSLLWDSCGLIVAGIRKTSAIVGRLAAVLSHILPLLLAALALTALLAAVVVAVACIPVQFWLCLAGLVVGAYVTYPRPRKAVR